ncbi:hypothetical protein ACE1CD_34325 [Aerosakkonema sp. BLCC-F183]|uniref:hypothetical protein n=1 Tax=Aerosakkonema sp. BLCC-F183 TaxID=3342834 RepID=UPI0035B7C1FC
MTQTPSNNGNSSRLDRIEAILERTVEDKNELRSALTQLTAQTVADREADRQDKNELRSALTQLTGRVNNLVERMGRYQEETAFNNSELARGQAMMTDLIRQLTLRQIQSDERQMQLEQTQAQIAQTQEQMREMQASILAAQERQERILDYLIRRSE